MAGSLILAELLVRSLDLFAQERLATRERDQPVGTAAAAPSRFLLHPFLGYTGNPAYDRGLIKEPSLSRVFPGGPTPYYLRNSRIQPHGFPSEHPDYAAEADGSTSGSSADRSQSSSRPSAGRR